MSAGGGGPVGPVIIRDLKWLGARVFVGFDLGAHFGYAVLNEDGTRETSGAWNFRSPRQWIGIVRTLDEFRDYVLRLGRPWVAYEQVVGRQFPETGRVYGGYRAMLELSWEPFAGHNGLPPLTPVNVSSVKKAATDHGGAKKGAMVHAATERWGITPSEDEADALWVAETLRLATVGKPMEVAK